MDSALPPLAPVIALLEREPEICAAFLHGSAVKGTMRPESDLDLAILPVAGASLDVERQLDLAARVAAVTGRQADIGILGTANLVYSKEVIVHGKLLFTKDSLHSGTRLALFLSLYADLQQSRKEVLRAYAA
jgi:predicted nucleotidyltransferase